MGCTSSDIKKYNTPIWEDNLLELSLYPICSKFNTKSVIVYEKDIYVNSKKVHNTDYFKPTIAQLQKFFPQSYAIIKNLYKLKVAYVEHKCRYSNNLPLETYKNCNIVYVMPKEYKDLDTLIKKEFDIWQNIEKGKYMEIQSDIAL
jgi:hypothetical protein